MIEESFEILRSFGFPASHVNECSALTLLALADMTQRVKWKAARRPLLRTVDIMEFIRREFGKDYKPNSREMIRRRALQLFEQARIVDLNPDDPLRATNSAKTVYRLTEAATETVRAFGTSHFPKQVSAFGEWYASFHTRLQLAVIQQFGPRFAPGASLLYIGDTAAKSLVMDEETLGNLKIPVSEHDKLPDIVLYWPERKWLFLIEAVTSHGPVSSKRYQEIEQMMRNCPAHRVYITAFPDARTFRKYAADVAWETEVWIAEAPDHMIHFNGEKFLGPYLKK
jgi:hypothetical protein